MTLKIQPLPSPNYDIASHAIQAVCLHGTDGPLWPSINWLRNPQKSGQYGRVSANYVISKEGDIYELVDWQAGKRAYGNGVINRPDPRLQWLNKAIVTGINPNYLTVSIEHEALLWEMLDNSSMPDAQFNASTELVITILRACGLEISDQTVIGHYQIDSVNKAHCPGVINPPAYIEVLKLRKDWYK